MSTADSSNSFNMVVGSDGIVSIQGSLLLATVSGVLRQSQKLFRQQDGDLTIDLAGVTHADSAGLALLIYWVREHRGQGRYLSYIHTPSHLLQLAEASDLENILPFAAT